LIHTLADIGSIVVTQVGGAPVVVRDLGRTTLEHQEREGIVGKDRNPDTIEGIDRDAMPLPLSCLGG
jgi:cobalt-zinc-cadmium resistance protein CzcA